MIDEVILLYTYKELAFKLLEFRDKNKDRILAVSRTLPCKITTKDGIAFWFMTYQTYERWCKGRTYYIGSQKYHSGYREETK